jgi:UTP--glucose-1-phosphate uridylyltransferase
MKLRILSLVTRQIQNKVIRVMSAPRIRTAVFPVAGLGTRFLPATKAIPKEMLVVGDKPLIQHAVEEARASGIDRFIFVTSQGKTAIEDHFDVNVALENTLLQRGRQAIVDNLRASQLAPGEAIFIRQQQPLGLGHAVWCARNLIGNQPFALILADDLILSDQPCLAQMIQAYERMGQGNFAAVMEVEPDQVSWYGILDIEKDMGEMVQAKRVVEKPKMEQSPSRTAIVGRYILEPQIFDLLDQQHPGVGQEIQLTDSFNPLMQQSGFFGIRFKGQRFDCGTKEGWLEANIAYACSDADFYKHFETIIPKYIK